MSKLERSTILQRAPELGLDIGSDGQLTVRVGENSFCTGGHALAVLDVFSVPISLADAIEHLGASCRGPTDWIELTSVVDQLFEGGALFDATSPLVLSPHDGGYDSPSLQIKMLDDDARTHNYLDAIAEVVRPGDVVVDIGTGTGILSLAAARAGARHVYAVEASNAAAMATDMFRASPYADRITLLRGWSSRVELPERADVLVSELIGHEPLEEGVLEYTIDARRRMLVAAPRLVPYAVDISLQPVMLPDVVRAEQDFLPPTLERWKTAYGFDFSALAGTPSPPTRRLLVRPTEPHEPLAPPQSIARIDLADVSAPVLDAHATLRATAAGRLDGVLMTFSIELSPQVKHVVAPGVSTQTNHWRLPLWLLTRPRDVRAGAEIDVRYTYEARRSHLVVEHVGE